nr:MAG TPA: hypothetical protein [Caudoviricetes sp.]
MKSICGCTLIRKSETSVYQICTNSTCKALSTTAIQRSSRKRPCRISGAVSRRL